MWKFASVVNADGEGVGALCKDEWMGEVHLGRDRKKMSGWKEDTLRRDARKGTDSAMCGRVSSCSCGQEWWRTELELCRRESFDDDPEPHIDGLLDTADRWRTSSPRNRQIWFTLNLSTQIMEPGFGSAPARRSMIIKWPTTWIAAVGPHRRLGSVRSGAF